MATEVSYEVARARNPRWANPEKNMIDLEVDFNPLDEEWLPYTALQQIQLLNIQDICILKH